MVLGSMVAFSLLLTLSPHGPCSGWVAREATLRLGSAQLSQLLVLGYINVCKPNVAAIAPHTLALVLLLLCVCVACASLAQHPA